jgi:multidrug efflux pump subunit AcrB
VDDVAKVDLMGVQPEAIYVELNRDRMAQLGVPTSAVVAELQQKNLVVDAGHATVGRDFVTIEPTGLVRSVEYFGSILIRGAGTDRQIYLRDIADVRRGYQDPPAKILRFDGQPAYGIAISTVSDGNVVTMGEALDARLRELQASMPLGMNFGIISLQSREVIAAIDGFVMSLVQAVGIVIVVLLVFMGLRSGLLIGFILLLTISGTFILMSMNGLTLERISLGALIIALGMLVDNAIVIVDGMLIKMQRGTEPRRAASEIVGQTAWPLLGATLVAILAFAAIGTSQDKTGEFTRSLFYVILYSLSLSWVFAVTVTPLLGIMFLKAPGGKKGDTKDPYGGRFYAGYRRFLEACIGYRAITIGVVVGLFAVSMWAFQFTPDGFFPNSTRAQFMVDYWLPQGTHLDQTAREVSEIEESILDMEGVTHVASAVGGGFPRIILTYTAEKDNDAYAQFFVEVDDWRKIEDLMLEIRADLERRYADAVVNPKKFMIGPNEGGRVQARIQGEHPDTLRRISSQVEEIFENDAGSKGVRTDWRQRVKKVVPVLATEQANLNGVTRPDVALALSEGFEGKTVGLYREEDKLLPIVLRAPDALRSDVASIENLQIWSPAAAAMIPIRQVVAGFETVFEDEIIMRKDRRRTIIVHADQVSGPASELLSRVRPAVEAIPLPPGYTIDWAGEYEDSGDAQAALMGGLPVFVLIMILTVIGLFNSLRKPLIIWLVVPLSLIGVSFGLLATQNPFDFMAILGFMSLMGMLIKNAIVLIDQINVELSEGRTDYEAVVNSGVSRLRPVAMAASTTAMGMIPLLPDPFFVAMAVTIICGLLFASGLTMFIVPTLYATFYGVKKPA